MTLTSISASLIILAHSITATYMGVDPEKVPPIKGAYTLPIKQLPNVCGSICQPPATGVYVGEEQKIYLGTKPYYKERFIFSQLLHETVHHFQRHAGVKRTCFYAEELQSQRLQAIYLKSKGATWVDDVFEAQAKAVKHGKCN